MQVELTEEHLGVRAGGDRDLVLALLVDDDQRDARRLIDDGDPRDVDALVAQLSWLNRGLECLEDTDLDDNHKAQTVLLVNGYVFWSARLAFQVPDDLEVPMVPAEFELDEFPALKRAVEANVFGDETPFEELFDYGLQRVLDGVGNAL